MLFLYTKLLGRVDFDYSLCLFTKKCLIIIMTFSGSFLIPPAIDFETSPCCKFILFKVKVKGYTFRGSNSSVFFFAS